MLERMRREQEAALREQYEDETAAFANPARMARLREEEEEAEMLRRAIAESEAEARERERNDKRQEIGGNEEDIDVESSHNIERQYAWMSSGDRVYDDDDAQLQAALRASLETASADFRMPDTHPAPLPSFPSVPVLSGGPSGVRLEETDRASVADTETETEPEDSTDEPQKQEESVSVEEMRRRRLARFGGT